MRIVSVFGKPTSVSVSVGEDLEPDTAYQSLKFSVLKLCGIQSQNFWSQITIEPVASKLEIPIKIGVLESFGNKITQTVREKAIKTFENLSNKKFNEVPTKALHPVLGSQIQN